MLKAKIKISQITNLTDARYFAAWDVDYLGFDIHPDSEFFVSPAILKEIVEWVEGPEIVLEFDGKPEKIWLQDYEKAIGHFLLETPEDLDLGISTRTMRDENEGLVGVVARPRENWEDFDISVIQALVDREIPVYLDIHFTKEQLEDIVQEEHIGLVLRGGEEEKVGVKSYDDLDDIFDRLME